MGFIWQYAAHQPYRARHRRWRWHDNDAVLVIGLGVLLWIAAAIGGGLISP